MTARALPLPARRELSLAAAGVVMGGLAGAVLAVNVPFGAALVLGACYAPLVVLAFPVALALWVPLVFLEGIPAFNLGGKAAGLLLAVAWIGLLAARTEPREVLRRHRRLVEVLVLLLLWLSFSAVWARDAGRVWLDLWHWWAVALVFFIIATSLPTTTAVRLVIVAFVVGAVLSVLGSLVKGDLTTEEAAAAGSRLTSTAGDPNFLAAALVPAIVLAAGLAVGVRSALWRLLLFVAIALMVTGLVATQSRGGFMSALVAGVAALIFFRRRRAHVIGVALVTAGIMIAYLSANPAALERLTSYEDRGTGRQDVWAVAWRVTEDHPILGVGLNNFGAVARDYVREPGALSSVHLIADDPHVVHNVYLQALADTGVVGLILFVAFAAGCLRAAWLAGMRFEANGDADMEAIARAVLVGGIAMLTSAVFISNNVDRQLWILFGLGPALLHLATRAGRPARRPGVKPVQAGVPRARALP